MQRSIATVSVSGSLPEKLQAIADAGFDGIELFENDLLYYPGSPAEIRQRCADLGLAITLFQPFRNFEGNPRDQLDTHLERARLKFDLMHQLGCDTLLVCSNVSPQSSAVRDVQIADLARLATLAEQHDIRVGYEALAWGAHVNRYRQAWDRVREVDSPAMGIVLDSFHILALGDSLDELDDIPLEKITFLQLADAPVLQMNTLEWSRHFRCFPGQGELPLAKFATQLTQKGYRGPWSLEIFNDTFRAEPATPTAQDGYRSLLYIEEQTRLALAQANQPALPEALFASAPLPRYHGVEFIEFSAGADDAPPLAAGLQQLGLVHRGDHRSKAVSLFQNGPVNVIVNRQPDSFAAAYHERHGLSMCALALKVEGTQRLLQRAQDYGYATFAPQAGPNERQIPAVCLPDGSLIYLIEQDAQTSWTQDFHLHDTAPPSAGWLGIDHLAMAIPEAMRQNWVMFLRSVLGFELESTQEMNDPFGIVRSQLAHSPENRVRLPLNISQSRETLIARTLQRYQGAGLQHAAFATGDIFSAVRAARELGQALLPVPENYYQDLAARFGLDQAFLHQLETHHVLYDRDEQGGELLHAYTRPVADGRFFFELLERRGGYAQYGEANAGVRLTMQQQP
ncbi:TIM barrel protein [Chimaeribacter arupi]|uniref:bifunctional sugar phosphate isomerase/epimerase/4-hydroxyphenylpyruvate dioxygenase family protein n=1 Tax=Chimaeribacter arupi TaxID=2060066 RepID=UPI0027121B6A|nr:sugar phosphate isomerase/epimerase and 4-hydroxyphenylpyruvate domain-containing protein [Chimaeribacter arupi]WKZ92382.1 TIM barrel protein [Chimaeribacter arupi]